MGKRPVWRTFYREERQAMEQQILAQAAAHRSDGARIGRLVDILAGGGALSFPHTFLQDNVANYLDICGALYLSRRTNLVFVGVLHSNDERDIANEFSLENFEYVLRQYADVRHLTGIPVRKKVFPLPAPRFTEGDAWQQYLASLRTMADEVRTCIDAGTGLLTTGDPCHFGYGYAAYHSEPTIFEPHPQPILAVSVEAALRTLFHEYPAGFDEGDYRLFAQQSRALLGDHTSAAIVVKELIGPKVALEMFEMKFSDYSTVLAADPPTLVASAFYGVSPR